MAISVPIELDESTFTGQTPAPFSVPSTPQLYNHDVVHDGAMVASVSEGQNGQLAIGWHRSHDTARYDHISDDFVRAAREKIRVTATKL